VKAFVWAALTAFAAAGCAQSHGAPLCADYTEGVSCARDPGCEWDEGRRCRVQGCYPTRDRCIAEPPDPDVQSCILLCGHRGSMPWCASARRPCPERTEPDAGPRP
jgi:hypothetical protein